MANVPLHQLTDVWTAGTVYNGISLDVTDTSSAAGSMLMTLKKDGLAKFGVRRDGTLVLGDPTQNGFVIDPQGTSANTTAVFAKLDETDYMAVQVRALRTGTLNALTASDPALWANQTWNNSGVAFTGLYLNITDTASALASFLMELKVNNVQAFSVFKNGWMSFGMAGSTRINFQPWDTERFNLYNDAVTEYGYIRMKKLDVQALNAITASDPSTIAQTWNNSGVAFTALQMNITNTASGVNSAFVDFKRDGSTYFKVRRNGAFHVGASGTNGFVMFPGANRADFYNWAQTDFGAILCRDITASWANNRTTDVSSIRVDEGWDNAGVDFTLIKATVTNTNSGPNSKLMNLLFDGVSQFAISKTGALTGPGVREKLTADRTYYVNVSTGNDTTGTGAVGAPWQTLESALFRCARALDLNGYTLKFELADGTYTGTTIGTDVTHPGFQGGGNVWIHGNDTNPENVIINGSFYEAIGAGSNNICSIFVSDCKLFSTSTTVVGVNSAILLLGRPGGGGRVILGRSAASWAFLISCYGNGRVQDNTSSGLDIDVDTTTTPIAGIAAASQGATVTLGIRSITGTPAWSNAGFLADSGGSIYVWGVTGSATGLRYKATNNGNVQAGGAGLSILPGNAEGQWIEGARFFRSIDATYSFQNAAGTEYGDLNGRTLFLSMVNPLTANNPGITINQTWNNAAVNFRAFRVDCTDTSSGSDTRLASFHIAGVAKAYIQKTGHFGAASGHFSAGVDTNANPQTDAFYGSRVHVSNLDGNAENNLLLSEWRSATTGPKLSFGKTRGGGVYGTFGATQANDSLGQIIWHGADATKFATGASLRAVASATGLVGGLQPAHIAFDVTDSAGNYITAYQWKPHILQMALRWIDGAANSGLDLNVTDTSSASTSKLMDLKVGGVSKLAVVKDGSVVSASTAASTSTTTGSIVTAGGAGIAGDVQVGGTISVQGGAAMGKSTISTSDPSGGNDGDIWYKVT